MTFNSDPQCNDWGLSGTFFVLAGLMFLIIFSTIKLYFIENTKKRISQFFKHYQRIILGVFESLKYIISILVDEYLSFNCETTARISQKTKEGRVFSIETDNFLITCSYKCIFFPAVRNIQDQWSCIRIMTSKIQISFAIVNPPNWWTSDEYIVTFYPMAIIIMTPNKCSIAFMSNKSA